MLKIDPDQANSLDFESSGPNGLNERILDNDTIEATCLAVIGGTILLQEENTLKRL